MKIISINVLFDSGSTGKLVGVLHRYLISRNQESIVLFGRGNKTSYKDAYKICSNFYARVNKVWNSLTGIRFGGAFFSTFRAIRIIKKQNPDIVHLHCINGDFINVFHLLNWLKNNKIKTILTLHAEFMFTAYCSHSIDCEKWKTGCNGCPMVQKKKVLFPFFKPNYSWNKMQKCFNGFDNLIITSVSPWLLNRAKQSPFFKEKHHFVILNGVDETVFKYYNVECLKNSLITNKQKVVFHATPFFDDDESNLKGGYFLLRLAKEMPDVVFVVAGKHAHNIVVPNNVLLLGQVSDQIQLAKYYSMSDLTLIVSQRETFSMVVAESLCCGTPVVGFKAGGPESIAPSNYSSFVPWGDIDRLKLAVNDMLIQPFDKKQISESAISMFSKETLCEEYESLYFRMINKAF